MGLKIKENTMSEIFGVNDSEILKLRKTYCGWDSTIDKEDIRIAEEAFNSFAEHFPLLDMTVIGNWSVHNSTGQYPFVDAHRYFNNIPGDSNQRGDDRHWTITITKKDLCVDDFVIGMAVADLGAIISLNRFNTKDISSILLHNDNDDKAKFLMDNFSKRRPGSSYESFLEDLRKQMASSVIWHEMVNVFNGGAHCQDLGDIGCCMHQVDSLPDAIDRIILSQAAQNICSPKTVFCNDCLDLFSCHK